MLGEARLSGSSAYEDATTPFIRESGFRESGGSGFNLSSRSHSRDRVQPFVVIGVTETFATDGATQIVPELRLTYAREVADSSRALTVTTVKGSNFLVEGVRTDPGSCDSG